MPSERKRISGTRKGINFDPFAYPFYRKTKQKQDYIVRGGWKWKENKIYLLDPNSQLNKSTLRIDRKKIGILIVQETMRRTKEGCESSPCDKLLQQNEKWPEETSDQRRRQRQSYVKVNRSLITDKIQVLFHFYIVFSSPLPLASGNNLLMKRKEISSSIHLIIYKISKKTEIIYKNLT